MAEGETLAETRRFDWLLPDVHAVAQDALTEVVVREIRNTVIDLCERAQAWQTDHNGTVPAYAEADRDDLLRGFALPGPDVIGGLVVDLRWISIHGRSLKARGLRGLDRMRSRDVTDTWFARARVDGREDTGRPVFYSLDVPPGDRSRVVMWPRYENSAPVPYKARIALKPKRESLGIHAGTTAEDNGAGLLEEYRETIVLGAQARLMRMPGQEWTNLADASAHYALYDEGVSEAKTRALGRTAGSAGTTRYGGIGRPNPGLPTGYRRSAYSYRT